MIAMKQIDFANRHLGGGVLHTGCIQEEIRFVINPECLAALLFSEVMEDSECIVIIGAERFSNYTGYSSSFEWSSDHKDDTPKDNKGRIATAVYHYSSIRILVTPCLTKVCLNHCHLDVQIVAIDALKMRRKLGQFKTQLMQR
jgi:hypothetical protein